MPNQGDVITPEIIRDTALLLLASYPGGIRQADLFRETEQELAFDYDVPEYAVKNALWDAAEKFPEFVKKNKLSTRNVVLLPTSELIEWARGRKVSHVVHETEEDFKANSARLRVNILALKFMDVMRYLELSELDGYLDFTKDDLSSMTMLEVEAAYGIRSALQQLRKYRNMLAHSNKQIRM